MNTDPQQPPGWSERIAGALESSGLLLWIGLVLVSSQIFALGRTDTIDDELFAYFGWCITQGEPLYLGLFDNKPPGIFWLNALGFSLAGGSYLGVAALWMAAVVLLHVAFFWLAAQLWTRGAALLGTALASIYFCHSFFAGATNRTETFVMLFEVLAIAQYVAAQRRPGLLRWPVIGICCGLALLFKQIGVAALGALLAHLLLLAVMRKIAWRAAFGRAGGIGLGVAVVVALTAGALAWQGALSAGAFATFGFNSAYFTVHDSTVGFNYANYLTLRRHALPILTLPLLLALAGVLQALLAWCLPAYRPAHVVAAGNRRAECCPLALWLIAIWLVLALYGAMLGPHAWRHYWLPAFPPLCLLGVQMLDVLRGDQRLLPRVVQRGSVLVALLACAYFAGTAIIRQGEALARIWIDRDPQWTAGAWLPTVAASKIERAGAAVQAHSTPDERMYCWNYYPGIYLHARRLPASRFATTEKTWQLGDAQAEFILKEIERDVLGNPPPVFVVSDIDYARMTGDELYRNRLEPLIGQMLQQKYEQVARTEDGFVVLRLVKK